MPDATHACRENADWDAICSRREKNATAAGAGRFENPAPDARAAPPEAHESLIGRKTVEGVPLTGLSFEEATASSLAQFKGRQSEGQGGIATGFGNCGSSPEMGASRVREESPGEPARCISLERPTFACVSPPPSS